MDASTQTSTALVSHDKIEAAVSARDSAMLKIEQAAAVIEAGYKLAQEADVFATHAADGFIDLDERQRADRKMRAAFDGAEMIREFRETTDRAVWLALIKALRLYDLMDKTERESLEKSIHGEAPPEVTADNIRATADRFRGDAALIFRRGLARAFSELDPRFKSHDAFKFESRAILDRCFDESGWWYSSNRHAQTIIDVERVLAVLDGNKPAGYLLVDLVTQERRANGHGAMQSEHFTEYLKIRCYKNGNAHLWFTRPDLVEKANRELAAFYGEVLPDAFERDVSPDDLRPRSNLPAKDLQFYGTPPAVAERLLRDLTLADNAHVLEPSAGEGSLVEAALARGQYSGWRVTAIEIQGDRVAKLAARFQLYPAVRIQNANFLNVLSQPIYDAVVMNPPFYGTHWMEHVVKAFGCLKPGGKLISILPVTAAVSETPAHVSFRRWVENNDGDRYSYGRFFRDLPPESFAASGTRINTVVLTMRKPT